jgi:hypothetical protein
MTMANAPLWDGTAIHIAWFWFLKNRNIFAKGTGQGKSRWSASTKLDFSRMVRRNFSLRQLDCPADTPNAIAIERTKWWREAQAETLESLWLKAHKIPVETKPLVTVIANGAKAVGKVFVRREEQYAIMDDVIGIEILSDQIDLDYLASELRRCIAAGNFIYEAKLFSGRARQLTAAIPIRPDGSFDLDRQQTIAAVVKRFDLIRAKLHDIGDWSATARIS